MKQKENNGDKQRVRQGPMTWRALRTIENHGGFIPSESNMSPKQLRSKDMIACISTMCAMQSTQNCWFMAVLREQDWGNTVNASKRTIMNMGFTCWHQCILGRAAELRSMTQNYAHTAKPNYLQRHSSCPYTSSSLCSTQRGTHLAIKTEFSLLSPLRAWTFPPHQTPNH